MTKTILGFAAKARTYCSSCDKIVVEEFLSKRADGSCSSQVPFEVNLKAVLAFRGIGCGYSSIKEWCGIINMPYRISQDTYTNTHSKLNVASQSTFREIQKKSIEAIFKAYSETGATPDQNGILDIAVSLES